MSTLTINDIRDKDILKAVSAVLVKQGKTKDGMNYDYLDIVFVNGWTKRVFLNSDGLYGLLNACEVSRNSSSSSSESNLIDDKSNLPF